MKKRSVQDFTIKFDALNADNQKYIIAVQQALMFAQSTGQKVMKKKEKECTKTS